MSKTWKFFCLFFLGKISPENASNDILQGKMPFKGVGPCFWSKISNFASLYLWESRPGICVLRYFRKAERLSDYKKKKLKRTKN